ncbi:MAG: DinB family protein [Candidatus Cloacimonetes bacterium]|nr:DinB family protein [Candidatus Cloacimonadota bacterium]
MTLQEYILGELKDVRQTLLFALDGLKEDDLTSMEPCGHWPIAWIAMHLAAAMDKFVNFEITGEYTIEHAKNMLEWPFTEPEPDDKYPSHDELVENWNKVMDMAIYNIGWLDEEGMQKCGGHIEIENWDHPIVKVVQWMIVHHHQHMRMLWTILGERRVDDKWDETEAPG